MTHPQRTSHFAHTPNAHLYQHLDALTTTIYPHPNPHTHGHRICQHIHNPHIFNTNTVAPRDTHTNSKSPTLKSPVPHITPTTHTYTHAHTSPTRHSLIPHITHTCTRAHTSTHAHAHSLTHARMRTNARARTYAYSRIFTHIHAHTLTP